MLLQILRTKNDQIKIRALALLQQKTNKPLTLAVFEG